MTISKKRTFSSWNIRWLSLGAALLHLAHYIWKEFLPVSESSVLVLGFKVIGLPTGYFPQSTAKSTKNPTSDYSEVVFYTPWSETYQTSGQIWNMQYREGSLQTWDKLEQFPKKSWSNYLLTGAEVSLRATEILCWQWLPLKVIFIQLIFVCVI